MKNHIRVDGQLLQTNKQYSALKMKQKEWISFIVREEFEKMVNERGREPDQKRRQQLLEIIYERICDKGIWIPFNSVRPVIQKKIGKLTRQYIKSSSSNDDKTE